MDYKKIAASSRAVTHMKETASIHSPDKDGVILNYNNNLIMIENQPSIQQVSLFDWHCPGGGANG